MWGITLIKKSFKYTVIVRNIKEQRRYLVMILIKVVRNGLSCSIFCLFCPVCVCVYACMCMCVNVCVCAIVSGCTCAYMCVAVWVCGCACVYPKCCPGVCVCVCEIGRV